MLASVGCGPSSRPSPFTLAPTEAVTPASVSAAPVATIAPSPEGEQSSSSVPIPTPPEPAVRQALKDIAKDPMARIADRVPGFGGVFRDSDQYIVYIYLQDSSLQEDAERVLKEEFGPDFFEGWEVEVLPGDYSMDQLDAWYRSMGEAFGQVRGIAWADLDERTNRIEIGLLPLRGVREAMESALAATDVPREAVVIEVGCDGTGRWPDEFSGPPNQAFLWAIDSSVEVASSAAYGETVGMKLTLRNTSDETTRFYLGGGAPYDFVVSTPDGDLVWHWKCAKGFLLPLGSATLRPGEEIEFTAEWEQVDHRGEPVPPGMYLVRGVLDLASPEQLVTEARDLEVLR